jgi:menaquinol-cytochrome c reductase iron-sulfur subunit
MTKSSHATAAQTPRRGFLKKSLAFIFGGAAILVPAGAALRVILDPLHRKSAARGLIRVANLEEIPSDGVPRKYTVLASKQDAWNKFANAPIGAVYLRRTGDRVVTALNVVCPHAGCFVDFLPEQDQFLCPCHKSSFKVDGAIANRSSPSPRGLDSLPVEIRADGSVWVAFQNFQAGRPDKVPVA